MKHYTLIIVCFIAMHMLYNSATGQITLTSANTPKAEYKYTFQKIQFNYTDLFHAGADTVWNISSAVFTGDTTTTHYTQDTAFDPFPGCAATWDIIDSINNLDFTYLKTSNAIYQVTDSAFILAYGTKDVEGNLTVIDPLNIPLQIFPFSFGSVMPKPANMPDKYIEWEKTCDAYGTLICPDTTYHNVLRIKTTDSTFYQLIPNHPGTTSLKSVKYEWYTSGSNVPVLSLGLYYSIIDYPSEQWWRDTIALLFQSKTYLPLDTPFQVIVPENSIITYPNPATNTITIEGNDSISELIIFNTSGFAVMHFNQITAGNKVTVNISALSKGLYIAAGRFTSGADFRKRFIVTED